MYDFPERFWSERRSRCARSDILMPGALSLSRPVRFGLLGLALAAAILVPFALWGEAIEAWTVQQAEADAGAVVVALLGSGLLAVDILLPVPSSVVGVFLGASLGPVNGALIGAVGLTLGCLFGYGIGRFIGPSLTGCLVTAEELGKGQRWLEGHGILALALLRPVPVLAEASVIAAGLLRISPPSVFLVTAMSNLGVSLAYASLGAAVPGPAGFGLAIAAALALPAATLAGSSVIRRVTRRPEGNRPRVIGHESSRIQSFSVPYEYPVVFTRDAFNPANPQIASILARREPARRHRAAIFVDDGLRLASPDLADKISRYATAHSAEIDIVGDLIWVPGGEDVKNDPALLQMLLQALAGRGIDRHSYSVAIGGGAVLDAVGYASAIFHRGVRHIRFPTTVLSQCDSGVGVKNAVNYHRTKNLIGTFAPPWAVINDFAFIDGLPPREKRAGTAEAVKVALIRDAAFFDWLEANAERLASFSSPHLEYLIVRSAELHMRQIGKGGDPFETGSARPLDYGHWAAHKLEHLTCHRLNHGEAVAIGTALDTRYSVTSGLLPDGQDERVHELLATLGFRLWDDALRITLPTGELALLRGLAEFREHLGGDLTVTLLSAIGHGAEVNQMDADLVAEALDWLERKA
jgi:3-dehydroquinate synthase